MTAVPARAVTVDRSDASDSEFRARVSHIEAAPYADESAVERVARAIAESDGVDWDAYLTARLGLIGDYRRNAAAAVAALSEAAVNASAGRLHWWADPARHEYRAADPARPEDGCASCGYLAHMHPNRRPAGDDPGGWRQQAVRLLLAIPDADDRAALVADALIAAYTRGVRHMADQLDGPGQGSDGLRDANNVAVEDVRAIAEALGIGGHARPYSAHEVVQREILPALRSLHAAEAALQRVREVVADWPNVHADCDCGPWPLLREITWALDGPR